MPTVTPEMYAAPQGRVRKPADAGVSGARS
jgi:hypothetical protein